MSRGVRDLRELICISRLNNFIHNEDYLQSKDSNDGLIQISQSQHYNANNKNDNVLAKPVILKGSNSKPLIKKVLRSINDGVHDVLKESSKYLNFIDENLLSSWLCKANIGLQSLMKFSYDNNFFVNFTNFWLVELPSNQRKQLLTMEYEILFEVIRTGLLTYITNNNMAEKVTTQLLNVAFWEYPKQLMSSSGYYLYLDYFYTLTSEKSDKYKSLLTDVKITTQDKKFIQLVLTIRAFALVTIWLSVINFYNSLIEQGDIKLKSIEIHLSTPDTLYIHICMAICHGFIPTLQYWIQRNKLNFQEFKDEQGRNLLILAVSYNSISVLQYFIKIFKVDDMINYVTNSGNSALHLAVCQENLEIVKILVNDAHADVNIINSFCDNCTPLHMALIYGQEEISKFLVENGAHDRLLAAEDCTTADMTKVHEQLEVINHTEKI